MDIYGNKLVNTIETKPLCASSSNLADMLAMVRNIFPFLSIFITDLSVCVRDRCVLLHQT